MLINIPSQKTINEYNSLRKTQRPVNIKSTSKELDEYVYDKTHLYGDIFRLSFLSLATIGGILYARKHNNFNPDPGIVCLMSELAYIELESIQQNKNYKDYILTNTIKKSDLYRKNGINTII